MNDCTALAGQRFDIMLIAVAKAFRSEQNLLLAGDGNKSHRQSFVYSTQLYAILLYFKKKSGCYDYRATTTFPISSARPADGGIASLLRVVAIIL